MYVKYILGGFLRIYETKLHT